MENKFQKTRWQFLFYINNNIICQRYIYINDYNSECINSTELKEMSDSIAGMSINDFGVMGIIPKHLKKKQSEQIWHMYDKFYEEEVLETNENEKFIFEVKVDEKTILKTCFDSKNIKPKHVDIKGVIPEIIKEMKYYMSLPEYTKNYMDYDISYEFKDEHYSK